MEFQTELRNVTIGVFPYLETISKVIEHTYDCVYITKKTYSNGTEKIISKLGFNIPVEKIKKTKLKKRLEKEFELKNHQEQQLDINNINDVNKKLKDIERKYAPKIECLERSMNRSKKELMDILINNDFDYFVTLTFDKKSINRLNDTETKNALIMWSKAIKRKYPNMTYVAVPEYHKKGGLHYHLLIGNITADEIGLVDSGLKVKGGRCAGQTIFNITKWNYGFSTATKILDVDAVKHYVTKYLTKQKLDPRFYNQKRYYTSQNINRVIKEKYKVELMQGNYNFDIRDSLDDDYITEYEDKEKGYLILRKENNGN